MPTLFINVTYDGDPELTPVIPFLETHLAMAKNSILDKQKNNELSTEYTHEKILDQVGRQ